MENFVFGAVVVLINNQTYLKPPNHSPANIAK